jgi:hypothetical protein
MTNNIYQIRIADKKVYITGIKNNALRTKKKLKKNKKRLDIFILL